MLCAVCIVMTMVQTSAVMAFEINTSQRLTNGVALVGVQESVSGDNTITPSLVETGRYKYDWADRNGDGSSNAVATAGLDLQTYKLWNSDEQSFDLYLNGGSITGDLDQVAFDTHLTANNTGKDAGAVRIFDVGDVRIGKILTYDITGTTYSAGEGDAGDIQIGTASSRAGSLRIAGLDSYTYGGQGAAGNITLYAEGPVQIIDGNGTPATIDTICQTTDQGAGAITIDHAGSLVAGNIHAYVQGSGRGVGGNVSLLGSGTGSCTVSDIITHSTFDTDTVGRSGNIAIRGYTDVSIAAVDTENRGSGSWGVKTAGNLVITNISNSITLSGALDLHSNDSTKKGYALLEAGGSISVADLDLDRVRYISFNSQSGETYITGALTNFTGTVGSASDTRLRAPEKHFIYYEPELNLHLNGDAYPLKGLDGIAEGGTLMVEPERGTVICIQ